MNIYRNYTGVILLSLKNAVFSAYYFQWFNNNSIYYY